VSSRQGWGARREHEGMRGWHNAGAKEQRDMQTRNQLCVNLVLVLLNPDSQVILGAGAINITAKQLALEKRLSLCNGARS
jgi:hypothetical protein